LRNWREDEAVTLVQIREFGPEDHVPCILGRSGDFRQGREYRCDRTLAQNSRSPRRRACLALLRSDLRDAPFALRPSSSGAPVRQSDRLAASATPSANTSKNAALVSRPCRRKKPAWRLNDWCRARTSSLLAISTNLRTVSLVQLLFERRFPALCIVMFLLCSGQPSLDSRWLSSWRL
jgi:hypothetical protein